MTDRSVSSPAGEHRDRSRELGDGLRGFGEHGREHIDRLRELIDRGAPWEACDAFRDAVAALPDDGELLYWGALAHARSGASHEAQAILDRAEPLARASGVAPLLTEILSLRGRLWKDLVYQTRNAGKSATPLLRRAREQYLAAYAIAQDPFPGVNAATLAFLIGDRDAARSLAAQVVATLSTKSRPPSAWDLASLGEAQLLAGNLDRARQSYASTYRACNANPGVVASVRRQLALLAPVLPDALAMLDAIPQVSVVAFAGHMIDAPNRPSPRFPVALEARMEAALRELLAELRAPIVFASAACGADLLFVEAALDRGAEVNLVLPFDRADFVRTSVAIAGDAWVPRFERAHSCAHRVVMATEECYLGDDVLFDHAARQVEGFAILRAAQLETEPMMVAVADIDDGASENRIGGTAPTLARWRASGRVADVIDLAALRDPAALVSSEAVPPIILPPSIGPTTIAQRVVAVPSGDEISGSLSLTTPRSIRSMLFADIVGYSRLHDVELPQFQQAFLELAASLMNDAGASPLEAKTWGDGLYLVFAEPEQAAEFALRLAERMRGNEAKPRSASEALAIRIALHAGAVFRAFDPVMRRDSHFGADVSRAARIEPITPPGLVYASEAFAATLASGGSSAYVLEYIGVLSLAKSYGESRIYRLERR